MRTGLSQTAFLLRSRGGWDTMRLPQLQFSLSCPRRVHWGAPGPPGRREDDSERRTPILRSLGLIRGREGVGAALWFWTLVFESFVLPLIFAFGSREGAGRSGRRRRAVALSAHQSVPPEVPDLLSWPRCANDLIRSNKAGSYKRAPSKENTSTSVTAAALTLPCKSDHRRLEEGRAEQCRSKSFSEGTGTYRPSGRRSSHSFQNVQIDPLFMAWVLEEVMLHT